MSKQPLEENGIHRAKLWEIGFYALNNTSTNLYMVLMGSISYFLVGIVGVGAVLAGSLVTIMRIWDGVTDPFVGMIVDNTNTKFGKNRPFIVLGNVILFVMSFAMFRVLPVAPTGARFILYIVFYMIYIVGYTFQCVVTKSAQSCMTNDPKQRPIFTMFDASYNTIAMSLIWPVATASYFLPKHTLNMAEHADQINSLIAQSPSLERCLVTNGDVTTLSGFYNPAMWQEMQLILGGIAALFAVLAIIGISRKDRPKYFGIGKVEKVTFRDYADVLAHNRAIQMLIVAASSDKLCVSIMGNAAVTIALYGIVCGNYALNASVSAITSIPIVLFGIFGIGYIARKMGMKTCLLTGTYISLAAAVATVLMFFVMDPTTMALPTFSLTKLSTWAGLFVPSNWSLFGVLFILLFLLMKGGAALSGNIVIPMTADCADYEVYRTKRYVPGLMGTLFSFVDKLISSLAATVVALLFATIGFVDVLPTVETPYSTSIKVVALICFVGAPCVGWLCNLIAMKFYPLSKEKMAEIQEEIGRIKAEAAAQ